MKLTPVDDKKISELYLSGKTAQQIADIFKVYKQSILYSLNRSKIPRRKHWKRATGYKSGKWKGGVRFVKGYKHLNIPGHNLARKDGWVPEHRLIMQNSMDRHLLKTEVVHHKDENKLNNSIENLLLYSSNSEHRKIHAKVQNRNKGGKFIK